MTGHGRCGVPWEPASAPNGGARRSTRTLAPPPLASLIEWATGGSRHATAIRTAMVRPNGRAARGPDAHVRAPPQSSAARAGLRGWGCGPNGFGLAGAALVVAAALALAETCGRAIRALD